MLTDTRIEQMQNDRDKEVYIANKITRMLWSENCTQHQYQNILQMVEKSIFNCPLEMPLMTWQGDPDEQARIILRDLKGNKEFEEYIRDIVNRG